MPPGRSDLLLDEVVIVEQPLGRGCDSPPALERFGDRRIALREYILVGRETGEQSITLATSGTDHVQAGQHPRVLFELANAEELRPQRLLVCPSRRVFADGMATKDRPPFCTSRPDLPVRRGDHEWAEPRASRLLRPSVGIARDHAALR